MPPPPRFEIHVDPSCLSNPSDSEMAPDRTASNQTIIHHELEPAVLSKKEGQDVELTDGQRISDEVQNRIDSLQIDRIEAQIQAAARAVVASIEEDNHRRDEDRSGDSELSVQTDGSYGMDSELTYEGTDADYETEEEQEGDRDSSSHHDGDIDDDVFSNSDHSKRSSLNSCHDILSADEKPGIELTSPTVGEEAADPVSRIPSVASYSAREGTPVTPSRVMARPPFRTPSSVRAMQMSSPTPSIFSSPRSVKRHLSTVSRISTPNSHLSGSPSKKTPTRFKAKKEHPLVLLHVTVLPLAWNYANTISSPELPAPLHSIQDNWHLLQHKLADTVLERGVLLPHPQDSYEVLEERLLEALELPVRPRVRILKCGHYMGPAETPSSDEEGRELNFEGEERKWCDICRRDVRIEGVLDEGGEKRFRLKIYASNGLMGPGSWAAAWREMERVDVEIEPFVESALAVDLERFRNTQPVILTVKEEEDDGFVDEEEEYVEVDNAAEAEKEAERESKLQAEAEAELREQEQIREQARAQSRAEGEMRRKLMEEERMREIYGTSHTSQSQPQEQPQRPSNHTSPHRRDDSLPELLVAAFKVAMRDRKNVAIMGLSLLVLVLALCKGRTQHVIVDRPAVQRHVAYAKEPAQMVQVIESAPVDTRSSIVGIPVNAAEALQEAAAQTIEVQIQQPSLPSAQPPVTELEFKTPPSAAVMKESHKIDGGKPYQQPIIQESHQIDSSKQPSPRKVKEIGPSDLKRGAIKVPV